MAGVLLTRRALLDIDEIDRYSVEQWGRRVADQYLGDLDAALQRLEAFPSLLAERPDCSLRLRFYRVREHVFVCDVISDRVYVLAVWHARMDLPRRLVELEPQLVQEARFLHDRIEGDTRLD